MQSPSAQASEAAEPKGAPRERIGAARRTLRHNLRCSVIDGTAYMVMVGLAEVFFPVFVLLMFKDAAASGLVLTLPVLLANLLQLGAPKLVRAMQSYRKAVVLCATVQCIACFPLAGIALWGAAQPVPPGTGALAITFIIASAYYAGAIVGGSPWSAMIATLVPSHVRTRFMGRRNRTLQLGAVVGVLLGAVLLQFLPAAMPASPTLAPDAGLLSRALHHNPQLAVFSLLFVLAGVARAISTWYLHRHTEPARVLHAAPAGTDASTPVPSVGLLRVPHAALALGVILFHGAAMLGSPFFAAYAREVGKATMLDFAWLTIVWLLGKALALNWAGDYAQRHGKHRLMVMSLVLMVPVPVLWGLSSDLVWLALAQLLAGVAIGAYELAVWFLTVDAFAKPGLSGAQRTRLIARFTLATALAGAATSSVAGSLLARLHPAEAGPTGGALGGAWAAFFVVFALSSMTRGLVALWMARMTRAGWMVGSARA
jgi:MFS family permease